VEIVKKMLELKIEKKKKERQASEAMD